MRKKELSQIPIKPADTEKQVQGKYLMMAHIEQLKNQEKVLVIELYFSKNTEPTYRLFMTKNDDITQQIIAKEDKWLTGCLNKVLYGGSYWYHESEKKFADNEATDRLVEDFTNNKKNEHTYRKIIEHQEGIREARLLKQYKKITDPIDEVMAKVPEIPSDFENWAFEKGMSDKEYLEYKPKGKKKVAWCSHCKNTMELETAKAGEWTNCPSCGSRVMQACRTSYQQDSKTAYVLQRFEDGFILREFRVSRTVSRVRTSYWTKEEYIHEHKRIRLDHNFKPTQIYEWAMFKQREHRWCDEGSYVCYSNNGHGILYPNNLDEVLEKTTLQYAALKELSMYEPALEFPIKKYIYDYESYKTAEHLIKNNLCYIARDFVENKGYSMCARYATQKDIVNISATALDKFLKVEKYDIKFLQDNKANMTGLEYLQQRRATGQKPIAEHMQYIQLMFEDELKLFLRLCENTKPGKLIKYLKNSRRILFSSKKNLIKLYQDYLDLAKKLNYDMSNDFVKFPLQLQLRHNQAINEVNDRKYKKIKLRHAEDAKKYEMEYKGLMIKVPESSSEIVKEGQSLHHCVGGYVDRVENGETCILFIRQVEKPNDSYYTMEVKQGKVVQVRGLCNKAMTPDVDAFVRKFKATKLKKKEKDKVKTNVA